MPANYSLYSYLMASELCVQSGRSWRVNRWSHRIRDRQKLLGRDESSGTFPPGIIRPARTHEAPEASHDIHSLTASADARAPRRYDGVARQTPSARMPRARVPTRFDPAPAVGRVPLTAC